MSDDQNRKYKYSIIQAVNKSIEQTVNIGVILYLNDDCKKYKIHIPRDANRITKFTSVYNKELCDFYDNVKDMQNVTIQELPKCFKITKPKTFTPKPYIKTEYDVFNELIRSFITIQDLKERKPLSLEVNKREIKLEIKIDSSLVDKMEDEEPGHSKVTVLIKQGYDDEYEVIGYLKLVLLNVSFDNMINLLDYSDVTEHFIHLFTIEDDEPVLAKKYAKLLEKIYRTTIFRDWIEPVVLEKCFIYPEYRGHRLLRDVLDKVIDLLRLCTDGNFFIFLKAFGDDEKSTNKLKKYYEEVGFVNLGEHNNGYIMCHKAESELIPIKERKKLR